MLMTEPTREMAAEWKNVFLQYKDRLRANKKTADEVVRYLKQKYPLVELKRGPFEQIVIDTIASNQYLNEQIPDGQPLRVKTFALKNTGEGASLYARQEEVFRGIKILIGVEFRTAYVTVEGSGYLHDEIVAFQGLNETDLANFFLVAEYVECLKQFDPLNRVLALSPPA